MSKVMKIIDGAMISLLTNRIMNSADDAEMGAIIEAVFGLPPASAEYDPEMDEWTISLPEREAEMSETEIIGLTEQDLKVYSIRVEEG